MSHTTDLSDGFYVIHNGDYSGNVTIRHENDPKVNYEIPFDVVRAIYLSAIRRSLVAKFENMDDEDLEEFLIEGC